MPDLAQPQHQHAYDFVTCMETLEHCVSSTVEFILSDMAKLVAPTGKTLLSVPIEIGPTFVIKAVVRWLAAMRGLSQYHDYEKYSLGNTAKMIFSTSKTDVPRPVDTMTGEPTHSHYGFNWRALRNRVHASSVSRSCDAR